MPIDRETRLRQAEKLQREGRIDLAIAEYGRLVEEHPRDWNSINALGDLYLRSGDVDRAVAQFVQIADHLFAEGFFPKAAAVYKKALKAKQDHEHALLRLAEIAAAQELLADARAYLRKLWELRSGRGDDQGAADCLLRLASFPEADVETRLTGARAARLLGHAQRASELFRSAAEDLERAGRSAAALDIMTQVLELDPSDAGLRQQLVQRLVAAGQLDEAGQILTAEIAGSEPKLLIALASLDLARGDDASASTTMARFVEVAPERSADVLRLAGELGRAGEPHRAFACAVVVVNDAVQRSDRDRAIDVLQSFLVHGTYIPALLKLVEVAADAGVEETLQQARERLVDAYLEELQGSEAQPLAEALLVGAPESALHAERLRRAAELAGAGDPDEAVRRVLERFAPGAPVVEPASEPAAVPIAEDEERTPLLAVEQKAPILAVEDETPFLVVEDNAHVLSVDDDAHILSIDDAAEHGFGYEAREAEPQSGAEPAPVPGSDASHEPVEIDLTDFMASLGTPSTAAPLPSAPQKDDLVVDPSDLEAVLNARRTAGADYSGVTETAGVYERGVQRLDRGQVKEGLEDLEEAARNPAFRFPAAARLGREYVKRGQAPAGIEWLGRAAEMPAPSREAGLAVLYDLALALESIGEGVRAFAVLMEISTDEPDYRDVRERIQTLARQEAERRG